MKWERKMKRGIDEKNLGPVFPRLHVNDTEKGGPRAPPRNKMALYGQLSIPSQRFGGANSTSSKSLIPSSSSQGGVSERGSFLPHQQTLRMRATDKTNNPYSDLKNQLVQQEQKKNLEDNDFRVPILVKNNGINLERSEDHQNTENAEISPFSSAFSGHLTNVQRARERNNSQNTKVRLKETNGLNNSIGLRGNGNSRDHVVDSRAEGVDCISKESTGVVGYGNRLIPLRDFQKEVMRSPNDLITNNVVSENSMVDSISVADISPDDVVGIIGQKHFWTARKAIVNQQRLFDTQVFELHRLIKVQKLIAGLPHLMAESDAFLGKAAKVSPIKKIPLEYVLKPSSNIPKLKDNHEKLKNNTREFSAENAVEKTSLSSFQNSCRSTFTGYQLPTFNSKMGSWSLGQQPGHQWLIPVMSPSEGLIYKPYPGPGHSFVNHGVPPPASAHYQWPTVFHPSAHGYFPPYGMTTINPSSNEEINSFNPQHQSSCIVPPAAKFHLSNNSEVQVSTSSSPRERTEYCDALPLFPTHPTAEGGVERPRAIRVVPRNPQLAKESVARIFQSIQEKIQP